VGAVEEQPREVLETRRLRLEPVSSRHAEDLYQAALASRAQLQPWMPWATEINMQSNQNYTAEAERSWNTDAEFHFVVLEDDLVLGVIGLNRDGDRSAELHYWIRSDRAGRGYATEAGERILWWGVEQLGLRTFTLWAGVDNHASRRAGASPHASGALVPHERLRR
jgi:ribosomal-protein-alanine N-acetyltransferase